MLIAKEKYKNNIAEYILYMFQIEDTIRACKFNIDLLEKRIIDQYQVTEKVKQEIRNWYADLIVTMHQEKIREIGHFSEINRLIEDLYILHREIIDKKSDPKYLELYYWALPNIKEFEKKLDKIPNNEIETCFIALYALLLLKLTRKKISDETLGAMHTFSNLLAMLSEIYKKLIMDREET